MAQAVALCSMVMFSSVRLTYSNGSTKHLKEIVLGRCWDFQRLKVHDGSTKNCSKIWETFYRGFAYKDPCNITCADYKPYFDEVGMDIVKPNKVRYNSKLALDSLENRQDMLGWRANFDYCYFRFHFSSLFKHFIKGTQCKLNYCYFYGICFCFKSAEQ